MHIAKSHDNRPATAPHMEPSYAEIRASLSMITELAMASLRPADIRRARRWLLTPFAPLIGLADNDDVEDLGNVAGPFVLELALFEPNLQGGVPFQRFLATPAARRLSAGHTDLAQRVGRTNWFSMFRVDAKQRHRKGSEASCMVLEDLLSGNSFHMMDRELHARW